MPWSSSVSLKNMRTTFSILVQVVGAALPGAAQRLLLRRALGWTVGERTKIGLSIIASRNVQIGADCRIGHLNLFWNLRSIAIGDRTEILNLNHAIASHEEDWPDDFSIGDNSKITSRHFFDCSGGIRIGNNCLIGGRDSQFWTHYFDPRRGRIQLKDLVIGDRCYVCARATLVYCYIPPGCVVGAGAVVTGDHTNEGSGLLVGNPAVMKHKVSF